MNDAIRFAAVFLAGFVLVLWERHKRLYMCRRLDQMLDQVLGMEQIGISDVKEGELSVLANKAVRIQEKLNYEVSKANKEKEQVKSLVSNMSHQLKTPLCNVVMYRDMLEGELLEQQRSIFLSKMKVQVEKLDWILQSLFKMVRLEQGAVRFEASLEYIKETLLLAVNTIYEKAEKKKISIEVEPFSDIRLWHNRKWTAEVFSNLLENAVKYSGEGTGILIRVRPLELVTQIQFADQGMGIKEEEFAAVFERFYRSPDVQGQEGSGIGLYLSRLILEQEKGYLFVESVYGEGSIFSVFLQNE